MIETSREVKISRTPGHLQITKEGFNFESKEVVLVLLVVVVILAGWHNVVDFFHLSGFLGSLSSFFYIMFGIVLAYYLAARNKTVIDVDPDLLTIKCSSIPFLGNKKVPSKTLKQLYCKKDWQYYYLKHAPTYTYAIYAITSEQKNILLLTGLDSISQARSIELEIEKNLNIEDMRVVGEFK